jgi:hypothetical protein
MPGWQITLITVGAVVLAAAAILLGRALAVRRHLTTADSRVTGARDRWHSAHPAAAGPGAEPPPGLIGAGSTSSGSGTRRGRS